MRASLAHLGLSEHAVRLLTRYAEPASDLGHCDALFAPCEDLGEPVGPHFLGFWAMEHVLE